MKLPLVSLSLGRGAKPSVEMIQENVYVRLPEAAVSMTALLTETSKKVKISMCELIMLDSINPQSLNLVLFLIKQYLL